MITNQLRKEELKIYNWQRYLYIDCCRHTFIVMYLLHLAHFVSSRRRMDDVVLGGMVGGVAGLPLLLDELVHVMLGPVLGSGDLEHVGGAEEGLLRVPVGDHLQ